MIIATDPNDPNVRTAWAIVCGYVPDSDEGPDDPEAYIAAAPQDWHEGQTYRVGEGPDAGRFALSEMIEMNAEDWHILAWLASAEVGDIERGYHAEPVERIS